MKKNMTALQDQIKALRERLHQLVEALPEIEEGVTFLGLNRCTVSLHTISQNRGILSPSYYLRSSAKAELLKEIDHTPIEALDKKIEGILSRGSLGKGKGLKFSPGFLADLRHLWYEKG